MKYYYYGPEKMQYAKSLLLGEIQVGTDVALICFARMCTGLRSMSLTSYER